MGESILTFAPLLKELAMLKEEIFFAIFSDYGILKQKPVPRAREAFSGAKPYFELLRLEKQKVKELELSIKAYRDEALNYKDMSQQLEARLKFHAELQRGGGMESAGGNNATTPAKGQRFEGEAGHLESMLRGSMQRRSSASRTLRQDSWSTPDSPPSAQDSRWPIYGPINNATLMSSTWKGSSSKRSFQASPQVSLLLSSRDAAAGILAQRDEQDKTSAKDEKKNNPFLNAVPSVKLVASEIDNLETYLRMYRAALTVDPPQRKERIGDLLTSRDVSERRQSEFAGSISKDEEGGGMEWDAADQDGHEMKPPAGHTLVMGQKMRRRKGVREARWRDFAIYLSRHPEARVARKEALQTVVESSCVAPSIGFNAIHAIHPCLYLCLGA